MFPLGKFLSKFIKMDDKEIRVFRGATLIMNMRFTVPFFIMFFGEKNIYLLSLLIAGILL